MDSGLAVRALQRQGVEVTGVSFASPFYGTGRARRMAAQLGIPLVEIDLTADLIPLVKDPPHGRGKNMNPCIDCHGLMLRRARALLAEGAPGFLFTGEVLNQRPMSQNARSLAVVAALSGAPELVLRPLSAQLLPETLPEREGWVDRSRLLDLSGRSRRRQIELAAEWGIREYPAPAGGCLLTDPGYSRRLADLLANDPGAGGEEMVRLRHGRHFRLPGGSRAMVGRNQADNEALESVARAGDLLLRLADRPGPLTLLTPPHPEEDLAGAVALALAHVPRGEGAAVEVREAGVPASAPRRLSFPPLTREVVERWRIG